MEKKNMNALYEDKELRLTAKRSAEDFLSNEKDYRMGNIEAELPHPLTRYLSQTYERSTEEGVETLFSVDREMACRAKETLEGKDFSLFAEKIRSVLTKGGRVIFSGCGSSGRLSMQLERSWRSGVKKAGEKYPSAKKLLAGFAEKVGSIMTGGDYAVIRSVESFEDSFALGMEMTKERKLGKNDLLIGVTATGETTSVLGTGYRALCDGCPVYMLICSDPEKLKNMERAKKVYSDKNCFVMILPCGPMALTGSTRMQSSTFEQFAGAVALEYALCSILKGSGIDADYPGHGFFGSAFRSLTEELAGEKSVSLIAKATDLEYNTYKNGGYATLYADDYLLDALTDTTERAPTFRTPPFKPDGMTEGKDSLAFVKHPYLETVEAWQKCFLREPDCIGWSKEKYVLLGFPPETAKKIPDISRNAVYKFRIGKEPMKKREESPCSLAEWIGDKKAPEAFYSAAENYKSKIDLSVEKAEIRTEETLLDIFGHLCVKLMLNTLSTGVMAKMGRITGNWMTCVSLSNKKLTDRGARIVSDLCGLPYEDALAELLYSKLIAEKTDTDISPVRLTLERLGFFENNAR